MFIFLCVIRQNFEYNLRILANFCLKTEKIYGFRLYLFKKLQFFFLDSLIKIILFTLKIQFFITKDAQSFVKMSFLVTCLHF